MLENSLSSFCALVNSKFWDLKTMTEDYRCYGMNLVTPKKTIFFNLLTCCCRVSHRVGGGGHGGSAAPPPILRFFSKTPYQNQCPPWGAPPTSKWKTTIWKTTPPHWNAKQPSFYEMIPRKNTINNNFKSS